MSQDINKEWENFISSNYTNLSSDIEDDDDENFHLKEEFLDEEINNINDKINNNEDPPKATEIYISTKTKIAYLNQPIDLMIFWNIPVISYATPMNGVIKKQIKNLNEL